LTTKSKDTFAVCDSSSHLSQRALTNNETYCEVYGLHGGEDRICGFLGWCSA